MREGGQGKAHGRKVTAGREGQERVETALLKDVHGGLFAHDLQFF